MEPEIGFLMNNMARVTHGSRILDPFVGCGTLLMAAAHLQNMRGPRSAPGVSDAPDRTCRNVGIDANLGDEQLILNNFASVGLSSSVDALTLHCGLAEVLLKDDRSPFEALYDPSDDEYSDGGDCHNSNNLLGLFDAIVTDPPYDMAEIVRSSVDDVEDVEEKRVRGTAAASSEAVGGVLTLLLLIAKQRLRVGGRLVFFAPYRDLSQRKSPLGDPKEKESDGEGLSLSNNYDNMHVKMKKRKAFKKREKKDTELTVEAVYAAGSTQSSTALESSVLGLESVLGTALLAPLSLAEEYSEEIAAESSTGPGTDSRLKIDDFNTGFSPLKFLPCLPTDLVLVEYYRQVMSPSFSRWLCVIEKRETKVIGAFKVIGEESEMRREMELREKNEERGKRGAREEREEGMARR